LKGNGEQPAIYWFSTCQHLIRTLPALQHDATKAEDVETESEDHAGDATRYLCMMRPWQSEKVVPKGPRMTGYCLDELWEQREYDIRHR
jgi:hypothetical protein